MSTPRPGPVGPRRPARPARPARAALALAATAAAAWPLTALFPPSGWVGACLCVGVLVAIVGVVGRGASWPVGVVVAAQAVAAAYAATWLAGVPGFLLGVLPTPTVATGVVDHLRDAGQVLATSAPPVPVRPEITLLLGLSLGAVATAVDAFAVTLRAPALAGLPLLAPYLAAVANSDGRLPWGSFALLALAWIALLSTDREPLPGAGPPAGRRFSRAAVGVVAAGAATVLALGAAVVVPTAPVRYLAGGYGAGGVGGTGTVGYSPEADMLASLRSPDGDPVLRYTSDDPDRPPLRVGVSTRYRAGHWSASPTDVTVSSSPVLAGPGVWLEGTERVARTVQVEDNRLASPHLAVPPGVMQGTVTGARWGMHPALGTIVVDRTPPRYRMTYATLDSARETARLRRAAPEDDSPYTAGEFEDTLDVTDVTEAVKTRAREVAASATTPYEAAVALQEWFRGGSFTYSLDVPPGPAGESAQEAGLASVDRFLADRRGYCVQFTTAYVLMARSLGIPARMATGFLPGRSVGARNEVLPSDAHAWPELHFAGVGWVRFEPTPGSRSGAAPAYSLPTPTTTTTPTARPTPTATATSAAPTPGASASPTRRTRPDDDTGGDAGAETEPTLLDRLRPLLAAVVVLAAGLAALAVRPVVAARRRRRRREAARGEPRALVEAHWADLERRLADLQLAGDPASPLRSRAERVAHEAPLDAAATAALARLAATCETARYSPAPPPAWSEADEAVVLAGVRRSRPWRVRLRARLLPGL